MKLHPYSIPSCLRAVTKFSESCQSSRRELKVRRGGRGRSVGKSTMGTEPENCSIQYSRVAIVSGLSTLSSNIKA